MQSAVEVDGYVISFEGIKHIVGPVTALEEKSEDHQSN